MDMYPIMSSLIYSEEYRTKALPHIKPEYFQQQTEEIVFTLIRDYVRDYNDAPTKKILHHHLLESPDINEHQAKEGRKLIDGLADTKSNIQWPLNETEKWIKDRAMYNAIQASIDLNFNKKTQELYKIPLILQDALAVSFGQSVRNNLSLSDLLADYVPPKYLIERLFKEGYLYTLTGLTGSGKTAIALYIAWCVALGLPIGERKTNGDGRKVIYFAGENSDDVTQRLCGIIEESGDILPSNFAVMPLAGREAAERSIAESITDGVDIALVIVDTSTAYFAGEDENNNTELLAHAKWLRSFSKRLPGNPTVLVCCHPTKFAGEESMIPRGGSAFTNEVDGNLGCIKKGDFSVALQVGKYRDVPFPEIPFKRFVVFPQRLKEKMPTILARHASAEELTQNKGELKSDDMRVLEVLAEDSAISFSNLAIKLVWTNKRNEADKSRAQRAIKRLRGAMLIDRENSVTQKGRQTVEETLK
jgi:predicted transcriptional regulator